MQQTVDQLAEMQDFDAMWNYYTKSLARAQKDNIPTKLLQPKKKTDGLNGWLKRRTT